MGQRVSKTQSKAPSKWLPPPVSEGSVIHIPASVGLLPGEFSMNVAPRDVSSSRVSRQKILLYTVNSWDELLVLQASDFRSACCGGERDDYMVNAKWRTLVVGDKEWNVEQHARVLDPQYMSFSALWGMEVEAASGLILAFRTDENLEALRPVAEKRKDVPLVLIQLRGGNLDHYRNHVCREAGRTWLLCAKRLARMPRDVAIMVAAHVWRSRSESVWGPREADPNVVRALAEKEGGVALTHEVLGTLDVSADGCCYSGGPTLNTHLEYLARQYLYRNPK